MENLNKALQIPIEKMNSLSHGLGVLFGIVCMPILILLANKNQPLSGIAGAILAALVISPLNNCMFLPLIRFEELRSRTNKFNSKPCFTSLSASRFPIYPVDPVINIFI